MADGYCDSTVAGSPEFVGQGPLIKCKQRGDKRERERGGREKRSTWQHLGCWGSHWGECCCQATTCLRRGRPTNSKLRPYPSPKHYLKEKKKNKNLNKR